MNEYNIFLDRLSQLKYDTPEHGRFGARRKYDIHTGLDLYFDDGEKIFSLEKGIVINIFNFTGQAAGLPWWEDTKGVLIRHDEYCLLYGEVDSIDLSIGDIVNEGTYIGKVKRVLKEDKGLPMSMLHIEMYELGYEGEGEIWELNKNCPKQLLNVEKIIFKD